MTGNGLVDAAMQLVSEDAAGRAEYASFSVAQVNTILQEAFEANNSIRESRGLEPLGDRLVIESLGDEIPFETELLHGVLPYGLARFFMLGDDENAKFSYMENYYFSQLMAYSKANYVRIK